MSDETEKVHSKSERREISCLPCSHLSAATPSKVDGPVLSGIFPTPLLALRQLANIRRMPRSSKLPSSDYVCKGNNYCNKRRCQICKHGTIGERIPDLHFHIILPNIVCYYVQVSL